MFGTEAEETIFSRATPENAGVYIKDPDFREAAEAVSNGISSAMNTFSGFRSSFLPQASDQEGLKQHISATVDNTQCYTVEEKKTGSFDDEGNQTVSEKSSQKSHYSISESPFTSAFTLHKPIPKPASEASSSSNHSYSTTPSLKQVLSNSSKSSYDINSQMVRMLDSSVHQDIAMKERSPKVEKPHEEIMAQKQKKWKRKMRKAQQKKKKKQEQRALEGDFKSDDFKGNELMNLILTVHQTECINFLKGHCGRQDNSSDSSQESGEDDSGEDSSSEPESQAENSGSTNRNKQIKSSRGNQTPRSRSRSRASRSSSATPSHRRKDTSLSKRSRQHSRRDAPLSPTYSERSKNTETSVSALSPNTARSTLSTGAENRHKSPMPGHNLGVPHVAHPSQHSKTAKAAETKGRSFINIFIDEMTSQGFLILLHKVHNSMKPSRVVLKIKPGYRTTDGSHCEPCLVWTDSELQISYSFSLFDVRSLEGADSAHLQEYPFAIPGRSVLLRLTRDRDFVFEAKSEKDAQRFVHGMRWAIARLAVNLVIGNLDRSCELLDFGVDSRPPKSLLEEAEWTRAMDDVTDQMIAKSVFHEMEL